MNTHKPIRVLIAEDQVLVQEMIRGIVEEIGYTVVGKAADGRQAVEMTQSLRPGVVLMDIQMPAMDGLEAARQIQATYPTPVIVLTAYETLELIERASAAGVGAYLIKPPNAREMERAILIAMARFADMMDLEAYARTVAHDIKSPLGMVVGAAEWLVANTDSLSKEDTSKYLTLIARNVRKTSMVVDSLLVLAQVRDAQTMLTPLDMGSIVAEALERLSWMTQAGQVELVAPQSWSTVLGHAQWVEEVWVNYISNAIKYSNGRPRVELGETAQPDGMVRFWVRDNGPGIPQDMQARLFIPFTRLENDQIKGHGLGLSIARRIVEKLGGQVGVDSEPGQGSLFSFTLPTRAAPAA